jgi:glycosyltransferase involved in cell wall biosynthesis
LLGKVTFQKVLSKLIGKKIAIDLTPMLPGGENGGAKWMTLELINALARLFPDTSFVLLTAEISHSELDWLDNEHPNLERMCVLRNNLPADPSHTPDSTLTHKGNVFRRLKTITGNHLSPGLQRRIKALLQNVSTWKKAGFNQLKAAIPLRLRERIRSVLTVIKLTPKGESLVSQIGADLLFCPFTAPFYAHPLIPTVSVVYDLQYRAYPQFFTAEELTQRTDNFRMAHQHAGYLVAISEFVRQTIIEAAEFAPEKVIAVPIGLLHPPRQRDNEALGNDLLDKHGLGRGQYILYPANFWRHKNHAMLLTAFNMYRQAHPDSTLKLVCTGSPGVKAEAFCKAVRRMGLADWVIYPGYVSVEEYDFLLGSAFAMIFPSLYEGFGIPLLEAMSAGVPVLCSDVTSLPEVGGDAVLYFDPRRPGQIVEVLRRFVEEPGLRESQITKGRQRAALFEGADRMAISYAEVFARALFPQNGRLAAEN